MGVTQNTFGCEMTGEMNGVGVIIFSCIPYPNKEDHAIIVPDGKYLIPFDLHGITSYFPTRRPTEEEVARFKEDGDYLELTAETPDWDPHSMHFSELESSMVDRSGGLAYRPGQNPRQIFATITEGSLLEPLRALSVASTTVSQRPGKQNAQRLAEK